jgi:hypothetical protein
VFCVVINVDVDDFCSVGCVLLDCSDGKVEKMLLILDPLVVCIKLVPSVRGNSVVLVVLVVGFVTDVVLIVVVVIDSVDFSESWLVLDASVKIEINVVVEVKVSSFVTVVILDVLVEINWVVESVLKGDSVVLDVWLMVTDVVVSECWLDSN